MQRKSPLSVISALEGIEEKQIIENPDFVFSSGGEYTRHYTLLSYYLGSNDGEEIYEKEAKELLQQGVRVNTYCQNDLFRYIFRTGNLPMIEELLAYGAEVDRDRNSLVLCLEYFTNSNHFKDKDLTKIKYAWDLLLRRPNLILFTFLSQSSGLTVLDVAFLVPKQYREIFLPGLISAIKSQALCLITLGKISDLPQLENHIAALYTSTTDGEKLNEITQRIKAPLEQWLNRKESENSIADKTMLDEVKPQFVPVDSMSEDDIKKVWEEAIQISNTYYYQSILNSKKIQEYEAKTCYAMRLALQRNEATLIHCLWTTVRYGDQHKSILNLALNLDTYTDISKIITIIQIIFSNVSFENFELKPLIQFYTQIEKKYNESKEQNKQVYLTIKRQLISYIQYITTQNGFRLIQANTFKLTNLVVTPTDEGLKRQKVSYQTHQLKMDAMKLNKLLVPEKTIKELSQKLNHACITAILNYILTHHNGIDSDLFTNFTLDDIRNYVENCLITTYHAAVNRDIERVAKYYHFAGKAMFLHLEAKPTKAISPMDARLLLQCFEGEYRWTKLRITQLVSMGWQLETLFMLPQLSHFRKSVITELSKDLETLLAAPLLPKEMERFRIQLKDCLMTMSFKDFNVRHFYMRQAGLILNLLDGSHLSERASLIGWYEKEIKKINSTPDLSAEYSSILLSDAIIQCKLLLAAKIPDSLGDKGDAKGSVPLNNDIPIIYRALAARHLYELYPQLMQLHHNNQRDDQAMQLAREGFQLFMQSSVSVFDMEKLLANLEHVFKFDIDLRLTLFKNILGDFLKLKAKVQEYQVEFYHQVESKLWGFLAGVQSELGNFKEAENLFQRAINNIRSCITSFNTSEIEKLSEIAMLDKARQECLKQSKLSVSAEISKPVVPAIMDSKSTPKDSADPVIDPSIKKIRTKINFDIEHADKFFVGLIFQNMAESEKVKMQDLYKTCIDDWKTIQTENDFTKVTPQLNVKIGELNKKLNTFSERVEQLTRPTHNVENEPNRSRHKGKNKKKKEQMSYSSQGMFQPSAKKNKPKNKKSGTKHAKRKNAANSQQKVTLNENSYDSRYEGSDSKRNRAIQAAIDECKPWPLMTNEPRTTTNVNLTAGNGTHPKPTLKSSESLSTSTVSSVVSQSIFNPGLATITPIEANDQSRAADEQHQPIASLNEFT